MVMLKMIIFDALLIHIGNVQKLRMKNALKKKEKFVEI